MVRAIPDATVIDPVDVTEFQQAMLAVITAALVDAILIAVGVLGFGYLIEQNPGLIQW